MAILEGGHIVPPRTQATSRSPAPLGLMMEDEFQADLHVVLFVGGYGPNVSVVEDGLMLDSNPSIMISNLENLEPNYRPG